MSRARFTEEFKIAAVKQVADHDRPVAEVAARLGVSTHSMYAWLERYNTSGDVSQSKPSWCIPTKVLNLRARSGRHFCVHISLSRRGNCHDNAVAESFFQLLKRERITRQTYKTKEMARHDIFDYIELFYNPTRRHGHAADLSPVNYERHYFSKATNCL